MYAYPTTLDEGMLKLMGREERIVLVPGYAASAQPSRDLKAMRRGGSPKRYMDLLTRAREFAPDAALRSTFITGFPGETEEHFEHLLEFVAKARLDHLGAFVFSPEPDIPSSRLPDRPEREVAVERRARLLELQEPISLASRQRLVGRTVKVLVEGVCTESEHLLQGRHAGQAPDVDGRVLINDGFAPNGSFADVVISEAFADDIIGHIVGPVGGPGVVPASVLGDA